MPLGGLRQGTGVAERAGPMSAARGVGSRPSRACLLTHSRLAPLPSSIPLQLAQANSLADLYGLSGETTSPALICEAFRDGQRCSRQRGQGIFSM